MSTYVVEVILPERGEMLSSLIGMFDHPTVVEHFYSALAEAMAGQTLTVASFVDLFVKSVKKFQEEHPLPDEVEVSFLRHVSLFLEVLVHEYRFKILRDVCLALGPKLDETQFKFKVGDTIVTHQLIDHGAAIIVPETIGTVVATDLSSGWPMLQFGARMDVLWEGAPHALSYFFNNLADGPKNYGWTIDFELVASKL